MSGTSASDEAMASVRRRGKIDAEIHAEKVSRLLLSGGSSLVVPRAARDR